MYIEKYVDIETGMELDLERYRCTPTYTRGDSARVGNLIRFAIRWSPTSRTRRTKCKFFRWNQLLDAHQVLSNGAFRTRICRMSVRRSVHVQSVFLSLLVQLGGHRVCNPLVCGNAEIRPSYEVLAPTTCDEEPPSIS